MRPLGLAFLGITSMAIAAAAQAPAVETTSLLGKDLARPALAPAFESEQQTALAALERRLAAAPGDLEATIWRGRRLGYLGRYREAVAVFTAALERNPDDARLLRHRGHRYLTLRRIDEAAADFERGLALVAGRPDQVEPDGLPNLFNQPTSTLKTNLWYHLGLARYLQGDFPRAIEAYRSALALSENPDMAVAAAYWLQLALRRAGRTAESAGALASAPAGGDLLESHDYRQLLRLLAGQATEAELLGAHADATLGSATLGYGIGAWHLVEGRPERARAQFEKVTANPGWSAFGVLAAEAELARWPPAPASH